MSSPSSSRGRKQGTLQMDGPSAEPGSNSTVFQLRGRNLRPAPVPGWFLAGRNEDVWIYPAANGGEPYDPNDVDDGSKASVPRWMLIGSNEDYGVVPAAPYDDDDVEDESNIVCKRARVPASSKAVQGLREARAGDAGLPAECAVCLQDFHADDKLRAMPCSHAFHQNCIFKWLRRNGVCPLCRFALPAQRPEDDDDDDEEES